MADTDQTLLDELLALEPGKIDMELGRMERSLEVLTSKYLKKPAFVLVAGSNGKGSTASFLESMLRSGGMSTGLYTSPHLVHVRERVQVNGEMISLEVFAEEVRRVLAWIDEGPNPLTYFEAMTLASILVFHREEVDIAILEVGLGGRLDATNAVDPDLSVITNISLEHTEWLGDTLGEIAWEKGGVSRGGIPLVTGLSETRLEEALRGRPRPSSIHRLGADFFIREKSQGFDFVHGLREVNSPVLGLLGKHQRENAIVAVEAAFLLAPDRMSPSAVERGLREARHPGRLEWIPGAPDCLLDGAHNDAGAAALHSFLQENPISGKTVFYVALKEPRDATSLFDHWREDADEWMCVDLPELPMIPRAKLERCLAGEVLLPSSSSLPEDWNRMVDSIGKDGRIVVAGSLYLVGAVRGFARERSRERD